MFSCPVYENGYNTPSQCNIDTPSNYIQLLTHTLNGYNHWQTLLLCINSTPTLCQSSLKLAGLKFLGWFSKNSWMLVRHLRSIFRMIGKRCDSMKWGTRRTMRTRKRIKKWRSRRRGMNRGSDWCYHCRPNLHHHPLLSLLCFLRSFPSFFLLLLLLLLLLLIPSLPLLLPLLPLPLPLCWRSPYTYVIVLYTWT